MLHKVKQADSLCSELECMLLLLVAANKAAHEHHSANLINLRQREVMSADRAAVVLVLPRRKTGRRFKSTVSYFLLGTFAEQISPQLSAAVKFQCQGKRGNSLVHMFGCRSVAGARWGAL